MIKENNARSFIHIAEGYLKSGMINEAIAVLKAGLQVYPKYLGARVSLGKAYLEKGMVQEALHEFEHVVNVSPDNIYAHKKMISIYRETGRIEDAIKSCEALLLFNPRDKEINSMMSDLIKEKGIPNPTLKNEFVPTYTPSLEKIGVNGFDEEEQEEDVVHEFATETMGDLFIAQGEIEKGMDIYRRLLENEPDNVSILEKVEYNLANVVSNTKQINRLQDLLEKVQRNKR